MTIYYQYDKVTRHKNGPYKEWYDDGTLAAEGQYINNQRSGVWTLAYGSMGIYKDDQKEGEWRMKDKKGNVSAVYQYKKGKRDGAFIIYDREDGRIFWSENAEDIYNHFRGLFPWPGLFAYWRRGDEGALRIKFHEMSIQKTPLATEHPAGTVLEIGEKIGVVTGSGVVFPVTLQMEGKEPVRIDEFIKGYPDFVTSVLV